MGVRVMVGVVMRADPADGARLPLDGPGVRAGEVILVIGDDYFRRSHCLAGSATRRGLLPHQTCYRKRGGTMSKISTQARRELVATIRERYRSASAVNKQRILDEFVALTDYHRKYAIRVLCSSSWAVPAVPAPPRERIYGEAVREALGTL
jgi:hypothetical protein